MALPTIEIYSSLDCPFAYLAAYRLRQLWSAYADCVRILWRALPLEYANQRTTAQPLVEAEREILAHVDPTLPYNAWSHPAWQWPTTMWPALEALACIQAQSHAAAFELSWQLRHAFFAESRNLSLRHELFDIARRVNRQTPFDVDRFEADWDNGRYKGTVISEARRGWHELKVDGSPTFVLPDGRQVNNPAVGEIDFDEETYHLHSLTPFEGDPLPVYRDLLDAAIQSAE